MAIEAIQIFVADGEYFKRWNNANLMTFEAGLRSDIKTALPQMALCLSDKDSEVRWVAVDVIKDFSVHGEISR